MIFNFHSNIVSITEQAQYIPEIKSLEKKPNFRDIIEYVYWNYDRDSIYHQVLLQDRLKIVHIDKFSHLNSLMYKSLSKQSDELVKKFNTLQYTENELLLEGMNKKIGEYLSFWNKTKITDDNHKLISDSLERAESLLKMKERLSIIINKENATRRMGSGNSTLIETINQE
jgi:hypothetical protein